MSASVLANLLGISPQRLTQNRVGGLDRLKRHRISDSTTEPKIIPSTRLISRVPTGPADSFWSLPRNHKTQRAGEKATDSSCELVASKFVVTILSTPRPWMQPILPPSPNATLLYNFSKPNILRRSSQTSLVRLLMLSIQRNCQGKHLRFSE
jgi:hypothetical protein